MYDGMNLYRAVVSYASSTTGDIQVRIPSILGPTEVVPICKIGRESSDSGWSVPLVGSQVVVAVEDDRFSNVYVVYPSLTGSLGASSGGASTPGGGASTPTVVESVPSGAIMQYAGVTAPTGWALCDGSEVSRVGEYAALFAVIGTTYGVGNNSTTFNLPNFKGRIPVGYDLVQTEFNARGNVGGTKTVTLAVGNLPPHSHSLSDHTHGLNAHTHTTSHTHTGTSDSHTHDHNDISSGGTHTHTFTRPTLSDVTVQSGTGTNVTGPSDGTDTTTTTGSSHTHLIANDSHSHSISTNTQSSTTSGGALGSTATPSATSTGDGSGTSTSINTLPPYIVVNYIIKV